MNPSPGVGDQGLTLRIRASGRSKTSAFHFQVTKRRARPAKERWHVVRLRCRLKVDSLPKGLCASTDLYNREFEEPAEMPRESAFLSSRKEPALACPTPINPSSYAHEGAVRD